MTIIVVPFNMYGVVESHYKGLTGTQKLIHPAEKPVTSLPMYMNARNPLLVGRRLLTASAIQPISAGTVLNSKAVFRPNASVRGHATGPPNIAPRAKKA